MFFKSRLEHLIYITVFFTAAIFLLIQSAGDFGRAPILLFIGIGVFNLVLYGYKVLKKIPEKTSITTYIWWNLGYGLSFLTIGIYFLNQDGGSLNSVAVQLSLVFGSVETLIFLVKLLKVSRFQAEN